MRFCIASLRKNSVRKSCDRRGRKEVFKNHRLEQLWSAMDEKIVSKELDNGKIVFDASKVSDEDILYFLNEASKALKVDGDTLRQMCDAFDREHKTDTDNHQ